MDLKEIRKQLEAEQAQRKEMADDTSPAPGPVSDTVQNMFDRTVSIISDEHDNNDASLGELNSGNFDVNGDGTKITKIFDSNGDLDHTIKDITHLTTQDQIYNGVENGQTGVKFKFGGADYITVSPIIKSATLVEMLGDSSSGGERYLRVFVARKGVTTVPTVGLTRTHVGTPIADDEATTKKYVDTAVAGAGGGGDKILVQSVPVPGSLPQDIKIEDIISCSARVLNEGSYAGYKDFILGQYQGWTISHSNAEEIHIQQSGAIVSDGNWVNLTISYIAKDSASDEPEE